MKNSTKFDFFILSPFLLLIWGILSILFFEKIPMYNGFGWDGRLYGSLAMDFQHMIQNHFLEAYAVQRIFPSFIIYLGLNLFHLPHTPANVINGFLIYSLAVVTFCGFLWIEVSKTLKLSKESKWLGFILLFCNYPFLKYFFYCPVSTDYTAFLLGLLMLYAGLKDNIVILFVAIIIAYFTWPAAVIVGIIFILFPIVKNESSITDVRISMLNNFFAGLFILLFTGFLLYTAFFIKLKPDKSIFWYLNLIISTLLVFVFSIYVFTPIIRHFPYITFFKSLIEKRRLLRLGAIIILLCSLAWIKSYLYNISMPSNFNMSQLLINIFTYAIELPFKFIVSHITYWGPSILLIIIFYREIYSKIFDYGISVILIVIYSIFFGLDSESRILLHLYPTIVILIITVIDMNTIKYNKLFWISLIVVSIIYSKVWLPINMPSTWTEGQIDFPFQRYFMQHGPWMSDLMYIIHALFSALVFYYFLLFFPDKHAVLRSKYHLVNNR